MSDERKRELKRWGLRIALAVLWCPLVAEVWLRVLDPVPMLPRYVCAKPYGVRGNEGNREYWHSTAEYRVRIRTNSRGIRADREIPYDKPPGIERIVLLGDSFGMGYGVDIDDMFTSRLVAYLKSKYDIDAEVVNLSTSGLGNAEELVVLQAEGLKYRPDLVLVAWHSTDYDDNLRSDLFALEDGRLVRRAETYLPAVETRTFLFRFAAYRFLAEHSNLYNFAREWAGTRVKQGLAALRAGDTADSAQAIGEEEQATGKRYREDLTVALLQRLADVSERAGAAFLVLDIPIRHSRTEFKSAFPWKRARTIGGGHVVSPIDLFVWEGRGRPLYWERSHGHFTPLGCDFVGRLLADYVAEHGLLNRDTERISDRHQPEVTPSRP